MVKSLWSCEGTAASYANSVLSEMTAKVETACTGHLLPETVHPALQRLTLFFKLVAKRMTQQVWNLPRKWLLRLHYGNSNCQQVFKHLTGLGNKAYSTSKQILFISKARRKEGERCLNLWFACCYLCRDQKHDISWEIKVTLQKAWFKYIN